MKKLIIATFFFIVCFIFVVIFCGCSEPTEFKIKAWAVSPEDGAEINKPEVELVWDYSIRGNSLVGFEIYLGTSLDSIEYQGFYLNNNPVKKSSLELSKTYYWYIECFYYKEGQTEGVRSEYASFTTADLFE